MLESDSNSHEALKSRFMKAVGFLESLPLRDRDALMDIKVAVPVCEARDILVRVKGIAVNPVDTKVRIRGNPDPSAVKVLGWDAAGTVEQIGAEVTSFKVGDEVYYAGDIGRPGCNSELHLVDERLAALKPASLTFEQAASLPLTSLTAWESLFERLCVNDKVADGSRTIIIIGGAGGVGSMAIQLARALTDLTVVATASRPDSREWCLELGAHYVLDHKDLNAEYLKTELGVERPSFVLSTTHSDSYFPAIASFIAPFGRVCLIDDPEKLDIAPFKRKSVSVHWEFMFTRSVFKTEDMREQGHILEKVAGLIDSGQIKQTSTTSLGEISAANLKLAHSILESGRAIGKIVLSGYQLG